MDLSQFLAAAVQNTWFPAILAGVIWILVMVSVPIFKWVGGDGAQRYGIIAGVLAQVVTVILVLAPYSSIGRLALIVVGVPVLGWLAELVGSRTGYPFGAYQYTPVLQPQILRVPVLIPLAWLMMTPPSWAVGIAASHLVFGGPNRIFIAIVAGLAFTSWDMYLDTQMVRWGFWRWERPRGYFGIPWTNFLGWFLVGTTITLLFGPTVLPLAPLVFVFAVTWILEFIGQFFFWDLKGSALVGALAMGVFVVVGLYGTLRIDIFSIV